MRPAGTSASSSALPSTRLKSAPPSLSLCWQFFYPLGAWKGKTYTAELTITQAVADRSHGGVIYYFCHIHSKMSGKIQIMSPDGTPYTNAKAEKSLYSPVVRGPIDVACGTTGVADYHDEGGMACAERFVPGAIDTTFDHCLQVCTQLPCVGGLPVLHVHVHVHVLAAGTFALTPRLAAARRSTAR